MGVCEVVEPLGAPAPATEQLDTGLVEVRPKPTCVQYSDWRQVAVEPLETGTPTLPVSAIIPYYHTPAELAALEGQTYPRDLFADESFARYGSEDYEFCYRAYTRGRLLVAVRWQEAISGGWLRGIFRCLMRRR